MGAAASAGPPPSTSPTTSAATALRAAARRPADLVAPDPCASTSIRASNDATRVRAHDQQPGRGRGAPVRDDDGEPAAGARAPVRIGHHRDVDRLRRPPPLDVGPRRHRCGGHRGLAHGPPGGRVVGRVCLPDGEREPPFRFRAFDGLLRVRGVDREEAAGRRGLHREGERCAVPVHDEPHAVTDERGAGYAVDDHLGTRPPGRVAQARQCVGQRGGGQPASDLVDGAVVRVPDPAVGQPLGARGRLVAPPPPVAPQQHAVRARGELRPRIQGASGSAAGRAVNGDRRADPSRFGWAGEVTVDGDRRPRAEPVERGVGGARRAGRLQRDGDGRRPDDEDQDQECRGEPTPRRTGCGGVACGRGGKSELGGHRSPSPKGCRAAVSTLPHET
jgi:hypothetical protein